MKNRFQMYNLNDDTYTVDTETWVMTYFNDREEIVIEDARVATQVMAEGKKV